MNRNIDDTYYRLDAEEVKKAAEAARAIDINETLDMVYDALKEKGYDPIPQIIGYLLTEDPIYITSYKKARTLICRHDRFEMMAEILKRYYNVDNTKNM